MNRFVIASGAVIVFVSSFAGSSQEKMKGFVRMKFNNPGLVVDMGVGIWGRAEPYDYDGDGKRDIVLRSFSKPSQWTLFYRNPGLPSDAMPIFPKGVSVDESAIRNPEGEKLPNLPHEVAYDKLCSRSWVSRDLDGDGRKDLLCVVSDTTPYGGNPGPRCKIDYHSDGSWAKGLVELHLYWYRNEGGEDRKIAWSAPREVPVGETGNVMYGPCGGHYNIMAYDWDADGDEDIIVGEFVDTFWYFENVGGKMLPRFAKGRPIRAASGKPLAVDLCMFHARMVDWDGDGLMDIIASDEDTRTAFYRNLGKVDAERTPVFADGRYFRQEAEYLKFGCLAVPYAVDWDGDGDLDFIVGNSAGYVGLIENLSGPGVEFPKWAEPRLMTADGVVIRTVAGKTGSPQGPAEAKWGYSGVSVGDWDGDGFLDVMTNDINGDVLVYRGKSASGGVDLHCAEHVEVEWNGRQPQARWEWRGDPGKALRAPWRTTAEMIDWNGDGLPDLVCSDHEGYLCLYARAMKDGKRVVLPPARVFCDSNGKPIRLNARSEGASGRRRFCFCDWNGDGLLDMIRDGHNGTLYIQTEAKDGVWCFRGWNSVGGKHLAGHTCAPCRVDFNGDGIDDYVGAAEDGLFYYLENPRSWEKRMKKGEIPICVEERSFDGTTRFVIQESERLVPSFGDFTISLEVKTTSRKGRQSVFSASATDADRGQNGMPEIGVNLDSTSEGLPYFEVRPLVRLVAKRDVADGAWHLVTVRRQGTQLTLSVDGKDEACGVADFPFFMHDGWAVGATANDVRGKIERFFKGSVRNVKVRIR